MQPKFSKRTVLWLVPLLLIGALFMYFKPDSNHDKYIALAQQYVVPDQGDVTFEQSLSAICDEEDWEFFETNRGQKVVEFSGECLLDQTQPLNIQFLIDNEDNAKIGALLVDHQQITEDKKLQVYEKIALQ